MLSTLTRRKSTRRGAGIESDDDSGSQLSADSLGRRMVEEEPRSSNDFLSDTNNDGDDHSMTMNSASCNSGGPGVLKSSNVFDDDDIQKLARRESRNVRMWRWAVIAMFVIVGAIVTATTYIFLTRQLNSENEASYLTSVETARDATRGHIRNMHQAFQGLASMYTAHATVNNLTWPYVTLPVFEIHGQHAREQSGVEVFAFAPLVQESERAEWLEYSWTHQDWIAQSREIVMAKRGAYTSTTYLNESIATDFYRGSDGVSGKEGPHFPIWNFSPPPFSPKFINWNLKDSPWMETMLPAMAVSRVGLFSNVYDLGIISGLAVSPEDHLLYHQQFGPTATTEEAYEHPHSIFLQPVFRSHVNNKNDAEIVGMFCAVVPWDMYLTGLLPQGLSGITAVVTNNCGQAFTYTLEGNTPIYVGSGDLHDTQFDDSKVTIPITLENATSADVAGHCEYSFVLYASHSSESGSSTDPVFFTVVVGVVFIVVIITFLMYDAFVQRRNRKMIDAATRSNAILSSLFPSNVRARLFEEEQENRQNTQNRLASQTNLNVAGKTRLRSYLDTDGNAATTSNGMVDSTTEQLGYSGSPIADLFPSCTVLFMDIAGFTAWSSVREPCQVFTLLETIYKEFDEIAKRRRVFKVETIGDCYVAVTGLPDPNKEHALSMARFARECMIKIRTLTKKLEVSLGPDTGDLNLRAGIHSGPVTAGVLRGERSRFQLFGDSVNTASRMESTGKKGCIQLSQDSADLLIAAGKSEWISMRTDKVDAKGKGEMQTYWLHLNGNNAGSNASSGNTSDSKLNFIPTESQESVMAASRRSLIEPTSQPADKTDKLERLIEWNVDVLHRLLKQIVARRQAERASSGTGTTGGKSDFDYQSHHTGGTTIDEVAEIVTLPKFNAEAALKQENPDSIQLSSVVVDQLYDYVYNVAAMYNENAFHNFEHASHVTMSVVKLLSRIVAPSDVEVDDNQAETGKSLHDHTYGITSDPLTQFACVFSALIHDADHSGVPNAQLVKEKSHIAEYYDGKSVAEQNSVDLAWHLLMDGSYNDLCKTIYSTEAEFKRFRQLVVNSVMATDIVDKELKTLRNARWAKAFSEQNTDADDETSRRNAINRKATIVIEHLIQASDVSHTMQHWHIYRKWNERFFVECYKAYVEGRSENNPTDGWYQGELGFYDFYIIPLAKKLKDCGVFGVSSDEYLNYAERNRKEWEARGREVVDDMVEKVHKMMHSSNVRPEFAS